VVGKNKFKKNVSYLQKKRILFTEKTYLIYRITFLSFYIFTIVFLYQIVNFKYILHRKFFTKRKFYFMFILYRRKQIIIFILNYKLLIKFALTNNDSRNINV